MDELKDLSVKVAVVVAFLLFLVILKLIPQYVSMAMACGGVMTFAFTTDNPSGPIVRKLRIIAGAALVIGGLSFLLNLLPSGGSCSGEVTRAGYQRC